MSVTTKQAAAWFTDRAANTPMPGAREMFEIAAAALREKAERDDPKPLTIDELKKMIGEPVWVQGPGQPEYGRWAIVEDAFGNSLYLLNDYTCHDIGKTWLAYRHKPKEG
jgi:hypothetical protein